MLYHIILYYIIFFYIILHYILLYYITYIEFVFLIAVLYTFVRFYLQKKWVDVFLVGWTRVMLLRLKVDLGFLLSQMSHFTRTSSEQSTEKGFLSSTMVSGFLQVEIHVVLNSQFAIFANIYLYTYWGENKLTFTLLYHCIQMWLKSKANCQSRLPYIHRCCIRCTVSCSCGWYSNSFGMHCNHIFTRIRYCFPLMCFFVESGCNNQYSVRKNMYQTLSIWVRIF